MKESRFLQFGTIIALFVLPLTRAIINESYSGYLFTVPDQPDDNTMTKYQAQQWCQSYDNVLLEIYDSQIQQIVEAFINKLSGQLQTFGNRSTFTDGARMMDPTWMWVTGNLFTEVDGLGVLNQLSLDYAFGYLLINQTGPHFIADNSSATKRSYICEGSKSSDCGFSYNGRCYSSYSTALSWHDARNKCLLNGGGDLASFDFIHGQQSLNSILSGSWITDNTPYWIGLRRQNWTWQHSGLEIKYTHWQEGRPQSTTGNNCLCLLPTGDRYEWTECNCDQKNHFICAINIAETTLPSMSSSSTKATVSEIGSRESPVTGSSRDSSNNNAMHLGVGIGVGVGGLLIMIVVVVVVVLLIRKRRNKGPGNAQSQRRLQTPDIIGQQQTSSDYAEIQRTSNDKTEFNKAKDKTNIVYSDLRITDAA